MKTTRYIDASFETLYDESHRTTRGHLRAAVESIDDQFGKGYAKANPSLVAAFMQAASNDFTQSVLAQQIRAGLDSIAESAEAIAVAIPDVLELLPQE